MSNIRKIQLVSSVMMTFCLIAMIAIPLLSLWVWLDFNSFASSVAANSKLFLRPETITMSQRVLAFITHILPVLVLLLGINYLRHLFGLYRQAIFFSADNTRCWYRFAVLLFLSTLIQPIKHALLSIILTWNNPPGQKALSVSFGSAELSALFVSGILLLVAWVMREGHRLARENAEFV